MMRVWRSDLDNNLKRQLFVTTIESESVLLYGAEAGTLTVRAELKKSSSTRLNCPFRD